MIQFDGVSKTFEDGTQAVRRLSLEVAEGESLVLLGTSGSGKTTSMKMINRLIDLSSGTIRVNGRDITGEDPIQLRRSMGYAIQGVGLFPHMTIRENIGVVPQLLKWPAGKIEKRAAELLDMVGLADLDLMDRYPAQLSGGQQQRVGVARALAANPPIILMDEPFGALDPITREQLQYEFQTLESRLKKTVIFVTHDIYEAVKMGDRIAILHQGELQQLDTPRNVVESPANAFVESFLGAHRFQLALMTVRLSHLLETSAVELSSPDQNPGVPERPALFSSLSLIDALDRFKETGRKAMPLVEADHTVGILSMDQLLSAVGVVFQRSGAES